MWPSLGPVQTCLFGTSHPNPTSSPYTDPLAPLPGHVKTSSLCILFSYDSLFSPKHSTQRKSRKYFTCWLAPMWRHSLWCHLNSLSQIFIVFVVWLQNYQINQVAHLNEPAKRSYCICLFLKQNEGTTRWERFCLFHFARQKKLKTSTERRMRADLFSSIPRYITIW